MITRNYSCYGITFSAFEEYCIRCKISNKNEKIYCFRFRDLSDTLRYMHLCMNCAVIHEIGGYEVKMDRG